jgi:DNA repair exonuclease SbcCD ATPase subunit
MRLLDINIKNYRAHRDLTVKFSQTLQVIGGRNESGKSTLAEAIHRALFLKSDGSGAIYKQMKSDFGGEPEIRLRFEQGGQTYVLFKRFLKNQVTQFGEENQKPYTDAEAEEQLARVIQAKTILKKSDVSTQWSHLWAWQDKSMSNPLEKDLYPHQDLLTEMHRLGGGAAVMQSPKDQKLAKLFTEKRNQLFTSKGLQVGSAAAKARERANGLANEVSEARAVLQEIQSALEQIRIAEETIEKRDRLDAELTEQLRVHNADLGKVEVLEKKVESLAGPLKEATESIEQLEGDKARIAALEKEATVLKAALEKAEAKLKPLAKRLAEAQDEVAATTSKARGSYQIRNDLQAQERQTPGPQGTSRCRGARSCTQGKRCASQA